MVQPNRSRKIIFRNPIKDSSPLTQQFLPLPILMFQFIVWSQLQASDSVNRMIGWAEMPFLIAYCLSHCIYCKLPVKGSFFYFNRKHSNFGYFKYPHIEIIKAREINEARQEVLNKEARYRFVIDAATIKFLSSYPKHMPMKNNSKRYHYTLLLLLFSMITSSLSNTFGQDKSQYIRIAKIIVDSTQLEAYKAALSEHAKAVSKEAGVLTLYAVYEKNKPTEVTVFEIYASVDAYNFHIQTPHL
jgi:quinol monooxygenase YgiN